MSSELLVFLTAVVIGLVTVALLLKQHGSRPVSPSPTSETTSELVDTMTKLSKRVRALEAESAADRGQIRAMEDRIYSMVRVISKLVEGLNVLIQQIADLGEIPEWTPPAELEEWLGPSPAQRHQDPEVQVYQNLGEYFGEDDLKELAFEMNVDYEKLPGVEKRSKARELTLHLMRRGELDQLIKYGREQRPNASWPDLKK